MVFFAGILIAIVVTGMVYQALGTRRGTTRHPAPGALIDACGQRLHVVCAGTGRPAVLFEAGIAASSLSWTRLLGEVATFTRACAYDRAGLGWSERSRSARRVDQMVAELRAVAANSAPGPLVLVGHSFGAFLALVYASRYPADVAGLVLLDPPTEWQHISGARGRLVWGGIQLSHVGGALARVGVVRACLALLTGGAPGVPRNFVRVFGPAAARTVEHLVGEVRKLPAEVHPVVQEIWSRPKCFEGMAEHLGALGETGAAAGAVTSLGDVPLAIVSSRDQPADNVAKQQDLVRLSSRGRHVVAGRSGHWIQFDQPDLVVEVIRDTVMQATSTGHS